MLETRKTSPYMAGTTGLNPDEERYLAKAQGLVGFEIFADDKISIKTDRGIRYYGPSKTSYYKLFYHSFTIMSVFKKTILFRSFIISIIYTSLIYQNVTFVKLIPFFFLSIFLSMIFTVSRRENLDELKNSLENIEGIETLK